MKRLGHQFASIINIAYAKHRKAIGMHAGELINAKMHESVDNGLAFDRTRFEPYAERTKTDRKRGGFQTSRVDFQRDRKRIKTSKTEWVGGAYAAIRFPKIQISRKYNLGQVMFFHQKGMGANPERHIFPEKDADIPQVLHDKVKRFIRVKLNEPIR
jgi:hypothetical protein